MSQSTLNQLKCTYLGHLTKALTHFEFSFEKVKDKSLIAPFGDLELLAQFESFSSRFSRITDIFVKKYLRTCVLLQDPSFRGGLMDLLNNSEKLLLISSADRWWEIRALRNHQGHEYQEEDIAQFYDQLKLQTHFILQEIKKVIKTENP